MIISGQVSRHAPLSSQANVRLKRKLSMLKMGRSLCDQEPSNTQKITQCSEQASGKTNTHPTITSFNSRVTTNSTAMPVDGIARPDKSGEDLFLRANTSLKERESITHRFDCNTVGPIPVASGYGSRTLTYSAAHVQDICTRVNIPKGMSAQNLSANQTISHEKIHTHPVDNDRQELSQCQTKGKRFTHYTGNADFTLPETNKQYPKNDFFT